MPSAANIKMDKQITSETASVDSASNQQNTPIRQAIVIIEHKIRNLEKRKAKLESYRELQNSGKDLNQDQRVAVAKYDEVVQTLEFARDLCKQFQGIAAMADKEAKKVARKEAAARSQQELAKVREVLLVQDALAQFGQDTVRDDFLVGRNGAVTLSEADLKLLDDIYPEVSPKHEQGSPVNFTSQVQTAAEHLLAVVDGKPKEAFGSTYSHVKEVIGKVHESGYFDQPTAENNVQEYTEEVFEPVVVETETKVVEVIAEIPLEAPMPVYLVEATVPQEEVPVVAVAAVLEQQQQQQQQFFQPAQPRPISEVLGTGTFYFLQDSELDSPEQTPQNTVITNAAIPSQTFTNQNFVSMPDAVVPRQNPIAGFAPPNPPPPIPMPPSHITGLEYAAVVPMQGSPMGYPAYQHSPVPDELQQPQPQQLPQQQPPPPQLLQPQPQQQPPLPPPQQQQQQQQQLPPPPQQQHPAADAGIVRNGGGDDMGKMADEQNNGSPKNGPRPPRNNNQRRNGPPNHGQGGGGGYHQSYYQHNNGYSSNNRQRPGRGGGGGGGGGGGAGGPRPGGNRPPTQNSHNKPKQAQQH